MHFHCDNLAQASEFKMVSLIMGNWGSLFSRRLRQAQRHLDIHLASCFPQYPQDAVLTPRSVTAKENNQTAGIERLIAPPNSATLRYPQLARMSSYILRGRTRLELVSVGI